MTNPHSIFNADSENHRKEIWGGISMCGHPHTGADFVVKTRKSSTRKSLSAYYSHQRIDSAIDSSQSVTATRRSPGKFLMRRNGRLILPHLLET
jgi:hypothetical protein